MNHARFRKGIPKISTSAISSTRPSDPEKRIKLVADPATGELVPKMMYHAKRTQLPEGGEQVQITLDESDIDQLETIVQRERKRNGMEPLPANEIEALKNEARQRIGVIEQPSVLYQPKVDIWEYQRGVCKIAYELACLWLGDEYLDDPTAQLLRNVILRGTEEKIAGTVQLNGQVEPLNLWAREPNAHIALCHQLGETIWIAVRVFDTVAGVLCVIHTASKYPSIGHGRFLLIGVGGGASRESPLNDELLRILGQNREDA